MNIPTQDYDTLQRLLKLDGADVPPEVEEEYLTCLYMYHSDGNSGPLGTIAVIGILRRLGLGKRLQVRSDEEVDWRSFPQDGTFPVEALYNGTWMPGVFLGFIEGGTIAIRLDGDDTVRECRKHMLRPDRKIVIKKHTTGPRIELPPESLPLDSHGDQGEKENPVDESLRNTAPTVVKPKHLAKGIVKKSAAENVQKIEEDKADEEPGDPKDDADTSQLPWWESTECGKALWIEADGDVLDGVLVSADAAVTRYKKPGGRKVLEVPTELVRVSDAQ